MAKVRKRVRGGTPVGMMRSRAAATGSEYGGSRGATRDDVMTILPDGDAIIPVADSILLLFQ
jgi:hypothetical protein